FSCREKRTSRCCTCRERPQQRHYREQNDDCAYFSPKRLPGSICEPRARGVNAKCSCDRRTAPASGLILQDITRRNFRPQHVAIHVATNIRGADLASRLPQGLHAAVGEKKVGHVILSVSPTNSSSCRGRAAVYVRTWIDGEPVAERRITIQRYISP